LSLLTLFLLIAIGLLSSGCVTMTDLEVSQEGSREVVGRLTQAEDEIQQTFTMRRPRLNSLTIWAAIDADSPSAQEITGLPLQIDLYHVPQDTGPFFSRQVMVAGSGSYYLGLPADRSPQAQTFLVRFSAPQGGLEILGENSDVYTQGAALLNDKPVSADIAFRTTYDYDIRSTLVDLASALPDAWLALPLAAVIFLPGWLLLDLSGLSNRWDGGERVALSISLSLAVIPLLMLWTTVASIHWNRLGVILGILLLAAAAAWRARKTMFSIRISPAGLCLAGIFFASLLVRLAMARDLAGPAWVDSVHHALITRLILSNGGFPTTYAPYLDVPANQYHSGFHSTLAVFQWLSGLQLPDAMLLYGNVLNAASVFAVYLFAVTLTRSRVAGISAALIAGLVTPMPAYYTSWGRYTELAGLLILPAVLAFVVQTMDETGKWGDYKLLALACLSFTGVLLVHYRVLAFLCVLLASYVISQVTFSLNGLKTLAKKTILVGSALILGGILLASPWILPNIPRLFPYLVQSSAGVRGKLFEGFTWSFLTSALGTYSLWAAGLGLAVGVIRLQRFTLTLVVWIIGLFCLSNLGALGIPGSSFINMTSVEICLFIPIATLGGFVVSQLADLLRRFLPDRFTPSISIGFVIAGSIVAVLGARRLLPLINPTTELIRQGDLPAMQWIQDNVAETETILINPFQWMTIIYAGNDGGYWISPLTGRKTFPPPAIYSFGSLQDIQDIMSNCQKVIQYGGNPDQLWDLMQTLGIHYVYTGVRGGPIAVDKLAASPHYHLLYAQQGAYLFKTLP
jgi:hypothetical protein